MRVGTLVLCAQLRPPKVLAKALATLDRVAGGRLVVGIGAGWYEPEYVEAGVPFERPGVRLRQLAETVDVLRGDVRQRRHPARAPRSSPARPIWVGGKGDRLLDVVARHADGWNTVWSWTPEAYRERARRARAGVRADRARPGHRDPLARAHHPGRRRRRRHRAPLRAPPGRDPARRARRRVRSTQFRAGRLVGTPEQVRDQLGRWAELGVSTFVVGLGALPFGVSEPDDIELVASALP